MGEDLEVVGIIPTQKTICTGVEMFKKSLEQGQAGDNVGILLRSLKREDVLRGQVSAPLVAVAACADALSTGPGCSWYGQDVQEVQG